MGHDSRMVRGHQLKQHVSVEQRERATLARGALARGMEGEEGCRLVML